MIESERRLRRVCFTGHRPHKLHGRSEEQLKEILRIETQKAYAAGFRTFITGMAMGVDIWAGEVVLELRQEHSDVRLICALPYKGFEAAWECIWQERYHYLVTHADFVHVVSKNKHRGVYQNRNEWMVDRSARVIAVYNGEAGGTRNTIKYARKVGIAVRQIDV